MSVEKYSGSVSARPTANAANRERPWLAIPFSSNEMRLGPRQWVAALMLVALALGGLRLAWHGLETIPENPNYRIPYSLGNDYWFFRRVAAQTDLASRIAWIGDSVVWGHYVASEQTLSGHLNRLENSRRFVNLAVNGVHPVAMDGLLRHYGRAIRDSRVVVLFNPLWITSRRQDLQDEREFVFNHPDLVPQFFPRIPCYVKSAEDRLGIVLRRYLPWLGWGDHVRMAYFGNRDMGTWATDHPYRNPLSAITFQLPSPNEPPDPVPDVRPWHEKGFFLSPSWVPLDESFQWRYFSKSLDMLEQRGNRVFVVLNPMNEHMMSDDGRTAYQALRRDIEAALEARGLPFHTAELLPTDLYADSSHPVAEGYAIMAERLRQDAAFMEFCGGDQ